MLRNAGYAIQLSTHKQPTEASKETFDRWKEVQVVHTHTTNTPQEGIHYHNTTSINNFHPFILLYLPVIDTRPPAS
jgi:hypothetical protein